MCCKRTILFISFLFISVSLTMVHPVRALEEAATIEFTPQKKYKYIDFSRAGYIGQTKEFYRESINDFGEEVWERHKSVTDAQLDEESESEAGYLVRETGDLHIEREHFGSETVYNREDSYRKYRKTSRNKPDTLPLNLNLPPDAGIKLATDEHTIEKTYVLNDSNGWRLDDYVERQKRYIDYHFASGGSVATHQTHQVDSTDLELAYVVENGVKTDRRKGRSTETTNATIGQGDGRSEMHDYREWQVFDGKEQPVVNGSAQESWRFMRNRDGMRVAAIHSFEWSAYENIWNQYGAMMDVQSSTVSFIEKKHVATNQLSRQDWIYEVKDSEGNTHNFLSHIAYPLEENNRVAQITYTKTDRDNQTIEQYSRLIKYDENEKPKVMILEVPEGDGQTSIEVHWNEHQRVKSSSVNGRKTSLNDLKERNLRARSYEQSILQLSFFTNFHQELAERRLPGLGVADWSELQFKK